MFKKISMILYWLYGMAILTSGVGLWLSIRLFSLLGVKASGEEYGIFWLWLLLSLFCLLLARLLSRRYRQILRDMRALKESMEQIPPTLNKEDIPAWESSDSSPLFDSFAQMQERLEQELEAVELQRLRQDEIQQMRSEFVDNVSHELKTPLTSIRGFVETLRSGTVKDPKTQARFLEIIDIEAERLHQLISDILELSEIEGMENNIEEDHFDLTSLLEDCCMLLADKAASKEVLLLVDSHEILPVTASRYRVKQILINLLDNSIKYNHRGGTVWLSARREPDQFISIRIKDNGPGIDEEHIPRIFERFYRVDKSHSREMGGTGLGLSIVKHIAQLYQGSATVESTPGMGSTFIIRLRIADDLK